MDERDRQIELLGAATQNNSVGVGENNKRIEGLERRVRALEANDAKHSVHFGELKRRLGKVAAVFDSLFQTAEDKATKAQTTADQALRTATLVQGRQEGRAAAEATGQFKIHTDATLESLQEERKTKNALLKVLVAAVGVLATLAGIAKLAFELFSK